jgi:hypothetical protein
MCKARYSILLDTNVLVRLVEDLDCEQNLCENLITRRLLCDCNLNATIIVPKDILKEVNKEVNRLIGRKGKSKKRVRKCKEAIKFCLVGYVRPVAVGGRYVIHEVSLQSYENSASELEKHPVFKHIREDYGTILGKVKDRVDKTLINTTVLQASEYKKAGNGRVVLLSMDRVLCEKVHVLASKAQLTNYLVIPCLWMLEQTSPCIDANYFMDCIRRCLNADCFMECLLGGPT